MAVVCPSLRYYADISLELLIKELRMACACQNSVWRPLKYKAGTLTQYSSITEFDKS